MKSVLKRLFNVLTVVLTLYFVVLLFSVLTGSVYNWVEFISVNGRNLVIGYLAIAILNFILFGKISLWNRNN